MVLASQLNGQHVTTALALLASFCSAFICPLGSFSFWPEEETTAEKWYGSFPVGADIKFWEYSPCFEGDCVLEQGSAERPCSRLPPLSRTDLIPPAGSEPSNLTAGF